MGSSPRTTRRAFLKGRSAVDALAAVELGAEAPLAEPQADRYLLRHARRAMACTFQVLLNAGQYEHGTEAALSALDLVDALEDQLSIYREHSEISRLNRAAAAESVPVERRLFELLVKAREIHRETDGAFDVTAGRLSSAWGFTRRSGTIPARQDLDAARHCVGSQYLELDEAACGVRFRRAGLEINLGSIGKGYALDRCAEGLEAAGIGDFLLHGGSSSVLARGTQAAEGEAGWLVGVRNPLHPERRIGRLRLKNRALATSGSGTQFFMHEGRRYGHILDPRSGWPAAGVLSVSVLAPSATEADALATAFYVLGPQASEAFCRRREDVAAVMLCPAARRGGIEPHVFGIDEREWTVLDEQ